MIRIICCGNRDRGDDGAGLLVADQLVKLGIPAQTCPGDAASLIEAWNGASDVAVIDAVVTGAPLGTVHEWNPRQVQIPGRRNASTHGFGVGEALALASTLGILPAQIRVCGIESLSFETGTDASPEVKQAAENVAHQIAALFSESRDR